MLALLALLIAAQGGEEALRARVAAQPQSVQDYFARRAMCNHWGGEEPYDRARRAEIASALRELGCATIDGEEVFLRRYFANRPDTLAVIAEARETLGW